MFSLNEIPKFQKRLDRVNKKIDEFLLTNDSLMSEVMRWILQNRGKQLRPTMMLLASSFGTWDERIIEFAAFLEIIHMASLVHDDIVDDAKMRRGYQSVQRRFGKIVAVYAGDFMIFATLSRLSFIPNKRQVSYFRSLLELCNGELLQYENLHNINLTEKDYLQRIQGKTGTLFRLACKVGAIEARCNAQTVKALESYGTLFGEMFQIQDDLMDFFGVLDMGKKTQTDLQNGIYSLPVIFSMQDPFVGIKIQELLIKYKNELDESMLFALYDIIKQTDGLKKSIQILQTYDLKIQETLSPLPDTIEKKYLIMIANQLYKNVSDTYDSYTNLLL